MYSAIEKWQASALVLAIVVAITLLALLESVDPNTVVTGLVGLGNLLLGAGAVAHGIRQGSNASTAAAYDVREAVGAVNAEEHRRS